MASKEEIKDFSAMIEGIVFDKKIGYMDAICHYCKESEFEVEVAATLISPPLKAKIKAEAEDNNLLKKTSRLPL